MSFMVSLPPIRHLACTRHSRKSHSGSSSKRARKNRAADVGIRLLLSLILLGFGSAVLAQEEIEQEFDFNIPQQAVHTALTEFAEQADLTLVFPDEVVRKKSANALIGKYMLQEGIDILLAGTGLTPRFSNHIVLSISADQQLTNKGNTMNMQKKAPLLKRLGTAIATAIFATSGAGAIAADDATADSNEAVIEEIVVTATKRDTSLQDTAIAITAFTTQDLYRQGIENFDDFARQTPGVNLTGPRNFQKFTIRGIQTVTSLSSVGDQKPVAVYYDEVPVSTFSVFTPDLRLYDVERVEVLRGPQGTSFGSGSLSGAARVITKKANLDGFDASVRLDGGSTAHGGIRQRYSGMVNVPVSDSAALRVVGYVRDQEGYIDNVGAFGQPGVEDHNDSEEWGARASLRWEPNDRSALTFSIMHDDIDAATLLDTTQPALGNLKAAGHETEGVWLENDHVNLNFEYDLPWAQLVSSTTWAMSEHYWDIDLDAIFTDVFPFHYNETQDQDAFVQELRLVSSHGGNVEWLAGLFYLNRQTDFLGSLYTSRAFLDSEGIDYSGLPNPPPLAGVSMDINVRDVENEEAAIFAELTYHFTETLSLTAGVRYTKLEYTDVVSAEGNTTDVIPLSLGGSGGVATSTPDAPALAATGKQSKTTTKFSINWQPNDDQTFYFTAAQGFRRGHPNANAFLNGGVSIVDPTDPTIIPLAGDSDELWNYELGAKTRWLDGRLRAYVAAYFIDWADIQVGLTRASDGSPYTGNSGDVESTGIEAELLYWPTANLQLGLNLTFASSEIVSVTQTQAIESGAVKGSPLAAPERQVSAFAQYTYPLGNGGAIYVRVDVQHVDEYPNTLPNVPGSPTQDPNANFQYTDAYENVNLQIGWETAKYALALYGENVFDNDDFVYINPDSFSLNRFRTLRPRTIGLRADWYF